MKMFFFKNATPMATAVLAITFAFLTTSMQHTTRKKYALVVGYTLSPEGECDITVACTDVVSHTMCRVVYPNGPVAFGKDFQGNCFDILWKSK